MKDKDIAIHYKQKLATFIDLNRYIYPVLAVVLSAYYFSKGLKGGPLYAALCVSVVLLVIALICALSVKNHIILTKNSLTIHRYGREKTISLSEVTKIKDTNTGMEIYTDKKVAKLSGLTYDINDLMTIANACEAHGAVMEEAESEKSLFPQDTIRVIMIVLMVLNFAYLVFCLGAFPKSMAPFYIISLVIPLFSIVYYYYLLITDQIELVLGYRPAFVCTTILPQLALWIIMGRYVTMSHAGGVIYTAVALFILWVVLFNLLCNLVGVGRDSFKMAQVFLWIPLMLVILNNHLPPVSRTVTSQLVKDVTVSTTKLSMGYVVTTADDEGNETKFNIRKSEAYDYAVMRDQGKKVNVETSKGIFNLTYQKLLRD